MIQASPQIQQPVSQSQVDDSKKFEKYLNKATREDAVEKSGGPIRRFFLGGDPVVKYIRSMQLHKIPKDQLDQKLDSPITLRSLLNGLIKFWETIKFKVNWS